MRSSEPVYRDHLRLMLRGQGFPVRSETAPPRALRWSAAFPIRADMVVYAPGHCDLLAVVECKVRRDHRSLHQSLGQILVYREAFRCEGILCFPHWARIPQAFKEVAQVNGVFVCNEETLVDTLREIT